MRRLLSSQISRSVRGAKNQICTLALSALMEGDATSGPLAAMQAI
jgi:hypothetical protein